MAPSWPRDLNNDAGYLLYRSGLRSGRLFNNALEPLGLRLRHYAVLRYLATVDGASQRELSDHLGYDPSAIVSLVDDLQARDIAQRRPHPADRRTRVVALTRKGHEIVGETTAASDAVADNLLAPLTPTERDTLKSLLHKLAEPT